MRAHLTQVDRYRNGRRFITIGDVVRVLATPGRRNGFLARVRAIKVDAATQEVVEVEVYGGPAGHEMVRTFRPERIGRARSTAVSRVAGAPDALAEVAPRVDRAAATTTARSRVSNREES
jgi:hypothetical protein